MPKGQIIEVNGIRYEADEDNRAAFADGCLICDYLDDHNNSCGAFCCEMGLYGCHFKRLKSCK